MELEVLFSRLPDSRIAVDIIIKSSRDYAYSTVFWDVKDYPSLSTYKLEVGRTNRITNIVKSYKEAQEWAEKEIAHLKQHLNNWRGTILPEDYTVKI